MKDEELRDTIKKGHARTPPLIQWLLGYRKISFLIVKWLLKTRITPNQVSCSLILIFLISITLISTGEHILMIVGAILSLFCIYLDMVDGDLARAKSLTSKLGEFLDHGYSYLEEILVPISIISAVFLQTENNYILLLGALIITNRFLYSVGKKNIPQANDLSCQSQNKVNKKSNRIQERILQLIGVKIDYHTLYEVDTRLFIFWLGCLLNQLLFVLLYYLVWSSYEIINMGFMYFKKYGKL